MRAGAGLQGRGALLGELGHCMAGAGKELLCGLLSGALVRGRAPPSTAVPAGPGAFRSSRRYGAGLAEAQGGDDMGSGAGAAPPLAGVGRA